MTAFHRKKTFHGNIIGTCSVREALNHEVTSFSAWRTAFIRSLRMNTDRPVQWRSVGKTLTRAVLVQNCSYHHHMLQGLLIGVKLFIYRSLLTVVLCVCIYKLYIYTHTYTYTYIHIWFRLFLIFWANLFCDVPPPKIAQLSERCASMAPRLGLRFLMLASKPVILSSTSSADTCAGGDSTKRSIQCSPV